MDIQIAIASYGRFKEFIHQVRPNFPEHVKFVEVENAREDVKERVNLLEEEGLIDVFVGSGETGRRFIEYVRKTPVVRVKVSGFDLLSAISETNAPGEKVAVIMFQERIPQISAIKHLLNVELLDYVYNDAYELTDLMKKLYDEGVQYVIGSTLVIEQAELLGMKGHYIWSAKSLQEALDIAMQIAYSKKDVQIRVQKMDLVLKNIHEGVLVTDAQGRIDQYNDRAEQLLRMDLRPAVGTDIEQLMPNIMPHSGDAAEYTNKVITTKTTGLLANISPIYSNQVQSGHVVTFQNIQEISSAREKILNMNARGFVAKTNFPDIIGQSPAFLRMVDISRRYASKESTIMIHGETGTGKELIAQSVHNASRRKAAQFVAINCASLPADLLESELFGYEEGAFTGARKGGKQGLFELADGGSIFLDEIGEISLNFQSRLLRVLEQREIMRIGSERILHVNIRVIAATNENLRRMVQEKLFRKDLYYRLNVLEIEIPPLRARREDIPLLILHLLQVNHLLGPQTRMIEIAHHPLFQEYDWPGNIRELSNVIERLCALYTREARLESLIERCIDSSAEGVDTDASIQAIEHALRVCGGNREKAAQMLGVSRTTLWRLIKKYDVSTVSNSFKTF